MCGIVGFVSFDKVVELDRRKWIEHALLVDQLRGIDSTGLSIIPKQYMNSPIPEIKTYKRALAAADYLQLAGCKDILADSSTCKFIMGHNRFATQGSKDDDNFAHPFSFGEITAMHNGTLTSRTGLSHTHAVDSAAITMELAELQPDKYTELLATIQGAYTLVWYNAANHHIYLARNDKRPLYCAKAYKGTTMFFASEEWMITWLMDRISIVALDTNGKGETDVWSMATDTLLSIDLNKTEWNFEEEKYTGYIEPPRKTNIDYGKHFNLYGNDYYDDMPKVALPADKCPYKIGDLVFADDWEYVKTSNNSRKGGKIQGVSYDFPEVIFVAPNITKSKYESLHKEWMEWKNAIADVEQKDDPSDVEEVFLIGEITCISGVKKQNKWIVNLKPKSVHVDFIVTSLDDILEDIEDIGEIEEKQSQARISTKKKGTGGTDYTNIWSVAHKKVEKEEWLAAVASGCGYCTMDLYVKDHDTIVWKSYIEHGEEKLVPICKPCSDFLFKSDRKETGKGRH